MVQTVKSIRPEPSRRKSANRQTVSARLDLIRRAAFADSTTLKNMLNGALTDRSPSVRGQAIILIAERRIMRALPLVLPLLRDASPDVRYDAAECVGLLRQNTGAVYPALRSLLSDKSSLLRAQAAESLAMIGDERALPKIARLLSDPDPVVRSYAAGAIADLNGSGYASRIEKVLRTETKQLARVGLLEAAFLFGRRNALNELLGLLASRDYHVRCSVANTLEFLPLNRSERTRAVDALRNAAQHALAYADRSAAKRVLKRLAPQLKHSPD